MILLINGPFGIGKTTLADELVRRLPNALHFDPELVGSLVVRLVRDLETTEDFQDLAAWPAAVVATADVLRRTYGRDLVVPMCLWRPERFEAIASGLAALDPGFLAIRLTASEATLRSRILGRPDAEGSHAWCLGHLERALGARDGLAIDTEGRTPTEVADAVLALL